MAADLSAAIAELEGAVDAVLAALAAAGIGGDVAAAAGSDGTGAEGAASSADGQRLVGGEVVSALYRVQARVGAAVAGAAAAFERSGLWRGDGARSAATWLAVTTRLPKGQVQRDVRMGRAVGERLPVARAAWAAGEIGEAHVTALSRLGGGRVDAQLAADEAMLVRHAKTLSFREFHQVAAYWEQLVDADGTDAAAEERRCRRDVTLAQSMDGMWLGQVTLDPVSGGIVAGGTSLGVV